MRSDIIAAPGYLTDIAYPPTFIGSTAPAWLDFVALLSGIERPGRRRAFTWCELGCGRGVTAAIFAATHPDGIFHAIDLMPEHIESARRLRDQAGIANLDLHAADFAEALTLGLPRFDYIVVHGVYSWIDERSRENLRRFIARHLAPSGLVYVSYNAMPGWASDLPFRYLLRRLADRAAGDSVEKFFSAKAMMRRFSAARALRHSPTAKTVLKGARQRLPPAFFPHEYLVPGWQAFYVTEVRADLATIGLKPVGSATLVENFDSFVLQKAERDALSDIADADLRELVRDYFLLQRFRRDVFGRTRAPIQDRQRRRELLACRFVLTRPPSAVNYSMTTPAGRVRFDNSVSRSIVAALAAGPGRLQDVCGRERVARDVLANAMAMAAAGVIRPVSPRSAPVSALNRALAEPSGGSEPPPYLALPCGTALVLDPRLSRSLRRGASPPKTFAAWPEFLASQGRS